MVLKAEVFVIKVCTAENIDQGYKKSKICILSEGQEVIGALGNYQYNSKLV
jgi:hypothetical protein